MGWGRGGGVHGRWKGAGNDFRHYNTHLSKHFKPIVGIGLFHVKKIL